MKPYLKNTLKIGCAAIAMGLLIASIAYAGGGNRAVNIQRDGPHVVDTKQVEHHVEDRELASFDSIDIDTHFSNVTIKEGEALGVELYYYSSSTYDAPIEYEVKDNTLTITQKDNRLVGAFQNNIQLFTGDVFYKTESVTVTLPKGADLKDVAIDAGSGSVNISDMSSGSLLVKGGFGAVTISSCTTGAATINENSSDIHLKDFYADTLQMENSFGSVKLINTRQSRFQNITVDTDSCDVELGSLSADKLLVAGSFADAKLRDLTAENLELKFDSMGFTALNVTAGHVEAKNSFGDFTGDNWVSRSFSGHFDSCNVALAGQLGGTTRITNNFGEVILTTIISREQYALDLSTGFGEIMVDGKRFGEQGSVIISSESAPNTIVVDADSCDVEVRFSK